MSKLEQSKSELENISVALQKYSLLLFKELLRIQRFLQPPSSHREIYRTINSYSFWQFSKLPKLISDALFGCISYRNRCDSTMFYSGLHLLMNSSVQESSALTFAMIDSDQDGFISNRDTLLILNHSVANPSLIRYQNVNQRQEQALKWKRIKAMAIQKLHRMNKKVSKCEYLTLTLKGRNYVHNLIWKFIMENFNVMQKIKNLKSSQINQNEISDSVTQESLSGQHQHREGYILLENQDKTLTKPFYRLINNQLLQFKTPQNPEYCSLTYLGHEAFYSEIRVKSRGYYKMSIKTGAKQLRFYFQSKKEHDYWVNGLQKIIGHRKVKDYYQFKCGISESVRKGKSLTNGSQVVIEEIQKENLKFEDLVQLKEQIQILQMCKVHPRITKLIEYFEDSEAFYLIYEFYPFMTLKDYFLFENKTIAYSVIRSISKQICATLAFLRNYNILHRNINPSSIYIRNYQSSDPKILIGDFSASTFLRNGEKLSKVCGLASFIAPQAIKFSSYDHSADMYSLGATVYFIMTGEAPYFDLDIKSFHRKILNNQPQFSVDFVLNAPADLVQFVTGKTGLIFSARSKKGKVETLYF